MFSKHGDEQKNASETREQKCAVLRKRCAALTDDVRAHGSAGEQQAGKIEDGVDPVGPAGDEAVKIAEGLPGPDVEAAFLRKSRGELVDYQRAGHKEEHARR